MKQALDLIFPQNLIKEPIIHTMSQKFGIVFNLRRAKITDKIGEIVLELDGEASTLAKAVEWLKQQGPWSPALTRRRGSPRAAASSARASACVISLGSAAYHRGASRDQLLDAVRPSAFA